MQLILAMNVVRALADSHWPSQNELEGSTGKVSRSFAGEVDDLTILTRS